MTSPTIERITNSQGDWVEVRSDERHFTCYDRAGSPLGTITRPRVIDREKRWAAFALDGTVVLITRIPFYRSLLNALRKYASDTSIRSARATFSDRTCPVWSARPAHRRARSTTSISDTSRFRSISFRPQTSCSTRTTLRRPRVEDDNRPDRRKQAFDYGRDAGAEV